jgi:hypothetical protein
VLIGDVDHYPSEYAFGVNQAMTRAGHWHSSVNIRLDMGAIAKRVHEVQPDVIWGHMLLWAPGKQPGELLDLCYAWKKLGTKVFLHDGDARVDTRFPTDISDAVDVALCNHKADRSVWSIQQIHWPYFAFDQNQIATAADNLRCDLFFAGRLDVGALYFTRTQLVMALKQRLGDRMKIAAGDGSEITHHTLFRTSEYAASANAVLGYGRPERNGWIDVRVFQYPGAGGILLHDDVGGMLEPNVHYLPYVSGNLDSVIEALEALWKMPEHEQDALRVRAFTHVQEKHSATARVRQALGVVGLTL